MVSQELDALVNMIFATTEAARFICRKLYKWFVYYEIDDDYGNRCYCPDGGSIAKQ